MGRVSSWLLLVTSAGLVVLCAYLFSRQPSLVMVAAAVLFLGGTAIGIALAFNLPFNSRLAWWLVLIGSLAMASASACFAYLGWHGFATSRRPSWLLVGGGVLGALFFGGGALLLIVRCLRSGGLCRLSDD